MEGCKGLNSRVGVIGGHIGISEDYIGVYRTPDNGALGPKYYSISGVWALKPYYFCPWTLRVLKRLPDFTGFAQSGLGRGSAA